MKYETYIKYIYYPVLFLILGFLAFIAVNASINTINQAKAEPTLPGGVHKFQDGNTTCYILSQTEINITASGVVGGISCVN